MLNQGFPDLDVLDKKLIKLFPRKIVRKGYASRLNEFKKLPNYVIEFQINKYADEKGFLHRDAIKKIQADLNKYSPEKKEKEAFKSLAVELGVIEIIDYFKVNVDLKKGKYYTHISNINEKASVNRDLLTPTKFQDLLKGGLWGKAKFQYIKGGDGTTLNMCEFEPFQSGGVVLRKYIKNRSQFSTDEWIDVLIRSIGYNSEKLSRKQKLLYLCRLIPLVEASTNSLELGPPGTGKSYIYENISEYVRVILGGDITPAKLIYNQSTRENGCIFNRDAICFDEMNKCQKSFYPLIPKLHQIMASNRVERGDMEAITDVSLIFQGNLFGYNKTEDNRLVPVNPNYLKDLPENMCNVAFLDRIHMFIYGWELPNIAEDQINQHLGLISNYFSQVLHKLRREDLSLLIDDNIEFYQLDHKNERKSISIRDRKALYHIISGLIKLIHPHRRLNEEEWREIVDLAIELRTNVIKEINKIEPTTIKTLKYTIISTQKKQKSSISKIDVKVIERIEEEEERYISKEIPNYNFEKSKIFINENNLLVKPITYWIFKILFDKGLLEVQNNTLIIKSNNLNDIEIKVINEKPLTLTPNKRGIQNFKEEEDYLSKIGKALNDLEKIVDKYCQIYNKISVYKVRLTENINESGISKLIENLESIEDKIIIKKLSVLNRINREINSERILIERSIPLQPNILTMDYSRVLKRPSDYLTKIELLKKYWNNIYNDLEKEFVPIEKTVKNFIEQKEKERKKQHEIFGGKRFPLFAFDMNNLALSLKKKYNNFLRFGSPMNKIITRFLNKKPYLAHFFASKHLEGFKRELSESEYVKWHIETMIKDYRSKKYVDVDATLTGIIVNEIEKYHNQISYFYLGSGDKDLHIVIDTAKKYNIPVGIIVIDEKNLSYELKESADNIFILK
ncbi:MAG: BREX system Lon protease-like protein BrxL [Candidatus Helarchaeota archaeon]